MGTGTGRSNQNKPSKNYNQCGNMAIQLESTSWLSGQELIGTVHIEAKERIGICTVFLILKGKEHTQWSVTRIVSSTDNDGNSTSSTETDYYGADAVICNFKYPFFNFPDGLAPGGYSIPFSLMLPRNIPGTLYYKHGYDEAKITYKLHTKIETQTKQRLKGRAEITIGTPITSYHTDVSVSRGARMKVCCCYDAGICKLRIAVPQDTYNPSQILKVNIEIDNSESQLDVLDLSARLYYTLRMRCNTVSTSVTSNTVIQKNANVRVRAGVSLLSTSSVEVQFDLPSIMNTLQKMYTTKGRLIECVYTLAVTAQMDGKCMDWGETPIVLSMINIVPNLVSVPSAPEAPPNWNPSVCNQVSLHYDAEYEVRPS
jgi:Arrestin (or S-antigen), N-terminal domain/Arrestin (or S-antigen), C-terminal domain